jgi:hypothetical protein
MINIENSKFTAKSNADLEKLTDMIHKLLNIVWGEGWGVFSEESPTDNDAEKAPMPHITCKLVDRTHTDNKAVKWSKFASEPDPEHEGETISSQRCWFTCELEFVIHAVTNREARIIAQRFEEFMETYVGYFKQEGVSEIIFKREKAPNVDSSTRQDIPHRSLCYQVRIERIITVSSYQLKQVDLMLKEVDVDVELVQPDGATDNFQSTFNDDSEPVRTHLGPSNFLDIYNKEFPSQKGGK